jgi:hypothetical protein
MSTAGEVIAQAFREGNFTAVGATPTAEEIAEALPRLRNLLATLYGNEAGEAYRDWYVPSALVVAAPLRSPFAPASDPAVSSADSWAYPAQNVRLLVKTTIARTVYLPANPSDGARIMVLNIGSTGSLNLTLDGNGHLIDAATTKTDTLTNLSGKWWFYRADRGEWLVQAGIASESTPMPLPDEFDDYFVCGLAIRLSTRFQVKVDDATVARFNSMQRRFKQRYRQSEGMPASLRDIQPTSLVAQSGWEL